MKHPAMATELITKASCQENQLSSISTPAKTADVVVLTSSLLIDRMFLYTRFLERLNEAINLKVWATSANDPNFQELWEAVPGDVFDFPKVRPYKVFPYDYLRRLNEFIWDFRHHSPSRISMWQHVRSKTQQLSIRSLRLPARVLATVGLEERFENWLEKLLTNYSRSVEAINRLQANPPALVVTTGPFQFEQPAIVTAAKKLGIPALALIPSWDNLSTKNRMVFKYDGYIVWSEQMKRELHQFYPDSRQVPIYVVGAPQFDIFSKENFFLSREEFCATQRLDPNLPIIVYAIGSPNFLKEHHGALDFAERVTKGELGNVQVIIRPHPIHDDRELASLFGKYAPRVVLQQTSKVGTASTTRSQDESQIVEWVNTFRHANVVINLSSTVTVDAAIFDCPIVNINYDPEPGQPNQELVKDVNHLWTHFKPVAESGGVWLANSPQEVVEAVKAYLVRPDLHREKRQWIFKYVCEYVDGKGGERMAEAIIDFVQCHLRKVKKI
jgi:hypothetical protein